MRTAYTALAYAITLGLVPRVNAQSTTDHFYEKTARFLAEQGYRNDPRVNPEIFRVIGSTVPTYVPNLRSDGSRLMMGIERRCPDSASATPRCVRVDLLEVYAGQDTSERGVVPLTFVGTRGGPLLQSPPSKEVLADAALTAKAVHIHVYNPPLLAPPSPAPENSPLATTPKSVPFVQGAMIWVYHQLQDLGYEPIRASVLDTLRSTFPETFQRRTGTSFMFAQARKSPGCLSGAPKGCQHLEIVKVSVGVDTQANQFLAAADALAVEGLPPTGLRLIPPQHSTRRDADTLITRFQADPKARPYTQD